MKGIIGSGMIIVGVLLASIMVLAQREDQKSEPQGSQGNPQEQQEEVDHFWGYEDPMAEMERFHRQMERFLQSRFGRHPGFGHRSFSAQMLEPRIDMEETADELIIKCDLPGIEKDKIQLSIRNDAVTIQAKRDVVEEEQKDESGVKIYRSERRSGAFYRTIPLPVEVDSKNAKASYENGVLTIHLPKSNKPDTRGIPIQVT